MTTTLKINSTANYISDAISTLPINCLFDKGKVGCGGTTLALTSPEDYIICVPFVSLIQNKVSQHSDVLGVYKGVSVAEIEHYLDNNDVKKIMVTYDSLERLLKYVEPKHFNLLVDELHILFLHYSFRKTAIQGVLKNYDKFKSYCFMTATPLEDDFMLDELKHLPKVEAVWDTVKEVTVNSVKCAKDVKTTVKASIDKFLSGNVSGNAYYFVNSVEFIDDMIKACDLNDTNCRVIYSANNKTKLGVSRGNTYDEPKKINFITSTAFEGCDIYDENGRIVIVSDSKKTHTLTDISTSFQQIAGRIRNTQYWAEITHIFTETRYYNDLTYDEFKDTCNKQIDMVDGYVSQLMSLDAVLRKNVTVSLETYVAKNDDIFSFDPNLVKIDLYNFKICKCLYKLRVNVVEALRANDFKVKVWEREDAPLTVLDSTAEKSFKEVVDELEISDDIVLLADAYTKYPFLKDAIEKIGFEGIKESGYVITNIKRKLINTLSISDMTKVAKNLKLTGDFANGIFISSKRAKDLILKANASVGLSKTPNIKDYYVVKDCMRRIDGKAVAGYTVIMPKIVLN